MKEGYEQYIRLQDQQMRKELEPPECDHQWELIEIHRVRTMEMCSVCDSERPIHMLSKCYVRKVDAAKWTKQSHKTAKAALSGLSRGR